MFFTVRLSTPSYFIDVTVSTPVSEFSSTVTVTLCAAVSYLMPLCFPSLSSVIPVVSSVIVYLYVPAAVYLIAPNVATCSAPAVVAVTLAGIGAPSLAAARSNLKLSSVAQARPSSFFVALRFAVAGVTSYVFFTVRLSLSAYLMLSK